MPRRDYERRRRRVAKEFTAGQKEYFAGKHKRRLEEIAETAKFEKDIKTTLANIAEKGAMSRLLKTQEFDFPERQGRLAGQRQDIAGKLQDIRVGKKLVEGETEAKVTRPYQESERFAGITLPYKAAEIEGTKEKGLTDIILGERKLGLERLQREFDAAETPAPMGPPKPGSAAGLGEEVAKPLPRKKGLLRSYTDAYFRASSTPLGYAMGLQGINTALQAYFKYGGRAAEAITRPAVRGLGWLVTPQERRRKERRIR